MLLEELDEGLALADGLGETEGLVLSETLLDALEEGLALDDVEPEEALLGVTLEDAVSELLEVLVQDGLVLGVTELFPKRNFE